MSRISVYALSIAAAAAALVPSVRAQAVISTRSGVIHYFEGAVYLAGQPLQSSFARFTTIPEGAELRTEQGRAEVLLTPGVVLRVGDKSAVRLLASALADTRVELLAGSAILDSSEPAVGTSVTLVYKGFAVRQPQRGLYRIDCEPPHLAVKEGEADVSAASGDPVRVEQGMDLKFEAVLAPETSAADPRDGFNDWATGRAQSIAADNAIAANIQDPASLDGSSLPADAFTYFPMLGFPAMSSSLSTLYGGAPGAYGAGMYGSSPYPYQPGFYSLYLPGYTYQPMLLHLPYGGPSMGLHTFYPPLRIGGTTTTLPTLHYPGAVTPPTTLRTPGAHPVTPTPPHPVVAAPHPAVAHPIGHR